MRMAILTGIQTERSVDHRLVAISLVGELLYLISDLLRCGDEFIASFGPRPFL